ncbi:fatty acid cis/trans isomerase [Arcobacter aquimarinus]|uniref:Fatty acid cis/trans isomerase n=1 Tax=Arcobacter aquimarinus TaxID=1315211 RepID=A0AAE7B3M3_9BACT|nr:fatty acid cis/trans isomerase [Arcobacter aquimarinus]QKE25099.1 fatty acid cis/trans isomerase [Arcobacter aquimarinus]RXI36449.1 peptidylprolyl isomerase [Arcobacter aquimarinus]
MKIKHILFFLITFLFTACSIKPLEPVQFETVNKEISFIKDIKPILDNRCVSCHSCYNSPCQLKLSSFEGIERGGSKADIYANRLRADNPTRLFIDATSEKEWREKGFFSVVDFLEDSNESIMMQYLFQKQTNPLNIGEYSPETDKLSCVKNKDELAKYFDENPHKGMPYGFPALKKEEYNLLMTWLKQGAIDDTKKDEITNFEKKQIKKFEEFLNNKNIKHQVTSRYIYEHLFLAHISFDEKSGNFFELIRSTTPTNQEPKIIATRFPYDKVEEPFYYRFKKIESTIVHKTHMVYKLDDKKLERYNELFIKAIWDQKPYLPPYDSKISANALRTFEQIPASSRYQFLLDDIHYIIMTFIRGPVCKGQIALNVIQDHFWVMFMDPKYDLSLQDKYFLHNNIPNLSIPNEYGEDPSLYKTFKALDNYELAKKYHKNRGSIYNQHYPNGLNIDAIWKGNKKEQNDSILTIYRHFDSASVHKGALGDIPKTLWVIDFPLLERIYYSLVAGFDIFGNTAHQLLVRTHMDRLRIEGESNFLEFLPKDSRINYFNSWYIGWLAQYLTVYTPSNNNVNIKYETKDFKKEFVNKVLNYTNNKRDSINFIEDDYKRSEIKEFYNTKQEIEESFKTLTLPNSSELIKHFNGEKSNVAFIKIELNSGQNLVYSMVVNRWHNNVALLFDEKSRLDPTKDRINFVEGFIGSYPNLFMVVKQNDLDEFFNLLQNYNSSEDDKKILKYAINRANPNFWEVFDWFDKEFKKYDFLEYGLFDLNRYLSQAINE